MTFQRVINKLCCKINKSELIKKVPDWSKIDRVIINLAGEWMGLGDVISVTPLVSAIRSASPSCKIYLILTGNRWKPIVDLMEGNPKTIIVQKDFYRLRKLWIYGLLYIRRPWLRTAYFYDYMSPRYRASLLGYIIGAEYRFGYGQNGPTKEEKPLYNTHNLPVNFSISVDLFYYSKEFFNVIGLEGNLQHYIKKNAIVAEGQRLVESFGITLGKRLFAMHPGCSSNYQAKRWPVELFAKLSRDIHSKYEICTLVILGPDDKELRNNWKEESFVYFLDGYSIYDIAAILSCCECLVSNDSGIMHLGFSLGVPGIGLFGPTNSVRQEGRYSQSILIQSRYNSICPPCYGTDRYMECAKIPSPCMKSITVADVLERIEELFQLCVV